MRLVVALTAVAAAIVAGLSHGWGPVATAAPRDPGPPVTRVVPGGDLLGDHGVHVVQVTDRARLGPVIAAVSRSGVAPIAVWQRVGSGFAARLDPGQVQRVRALAGVESVQPDLPIELAAGEQIDPPWGIDRLDQVALPLDQRYRYDHTGRGVTAYVVDSGIRTTHVEFQGRIPYGFAAQFAGEAEPTVEDCFGHGTHVSGILGGTTFGVAKEVTIVPVRVFSCERASTVAIVVAALDAVLADHLARSPGHLAVANLSLGGTAGTVGYEALDAAVEALVDAGITVVVAAGNGAADTCTVSPARLPGVIAVAATTSSDRRASFSNTGPCNDLFAPGSAITSAWIGSDTATNVSGGTSMAAPHVAGAVALALAESPGTPAEVRARLDAVATRGVVRELAAGDPDRFVHIVSSSPQPSVSESPPPGFEPVGPVRLVDTRRATSDRPAGRVTPTEPLRVRVSDREGLPAAGVVAVALNVTATAGLEPGYLTVYPCGERPVASNVNYLAGETVATAVVASVSADGDVCVHADSEVHVVMDIGGWMGEGAGLTGLTPSRLLDTRPSGSTVDGRFERLGTRVAGSVIEVDVSGRGGVPEGAGAAVLNVTVRGGGQPGFVTVFPCGSRPATSNVNHGPAATVANAVLTSLSVRGTVCLYTEQAAHLIVDVMAAVSAPSAYQSVVPRRLADTRNGEGGVAVGRVDRAAPLVVQVGGRPGVPPTGVVAASMTITVTGATQPGYVTAYPCADRPLASHVNYLAGMARANAAIVPVSADGRVCVYAESPVHVVVDLDGTFVSAP